MTPYEYEIFVSEYFRSNGYTVSQTSISNDYGVDLFAFKENEKLAIQVKMYGGSTRSVNRRVFMELHGVKDYFDCTKAVLVTDGSILDNAKEVAQKLGINILQLNPPSLQAPYENQDNAINFDTIWKNYVLPLEGHTIIRSNGDTNKILTVDGSGITRITSNGRRQHISIEIIKKTINHILCNGSITRKMINEEYEGRASSGIVLLLSQVPIFEQMKDPLGIKMKESKR
jgi:restriction system protein